MPGWQDKEREVRRTIEDRGYAVQDANNLFRANCPNIDLVVFAKTKAFYIQVKSSETPASKNGVIVDGSPWTKAQLYQGASIFNKHCKAGQYEATLVVILDRQKDVITTCKTTFYVAPPKSLEDLVRERDLVFADRPKRDGSRRSIGFRKELPRDVLEPWREAWHLLDS